MAATGDVVSYADHELTALVALGRATLLQLRRVTAAKLAKAKAHLSALPSRCPLHQLVAAQVRVRRAGEALLKYSDALECIETLGSSNQGR